MGGRASELTTVHGVVHDEVQEAEASENTRTCAMRICCCTAENRSIKSAARD